MYKHQEVKCVNSVCGVFFDWSIMVGYTAECELGTLKQDVFLSPSFRLEVVHCFSWRNIGYCTPSITIQRHIHRVFLFLTASWGKWRMVQRIPDNGVVLNAKVMELFSSTKVFLKVNGSRATPMGRELYTLRCLAKKVFVGPTKRTTNSTNFWYGEFLSSIF